MMTQMRDKPESRGGGGLGVVSDSCSLVFIRGFKNSVSQLICRI